MENGRSAQVPRALLDRIVEHWRPVEVWLFGSRARGDFRDQSDWDFVVVVDDDSPEDLLDVVAARRVVRPFRMPIDIIPVRRADWIEGLQWFGSLSQVVTAEGRRLHARQPDHHQLAEGRGAGP